MSRIKVAVFASGTGSNFQALMETKSLACDIVLLVCDKHDAPVIQKAKANGVATFIFDPKSYSSKQAYEQEITDRLKAASVSWVFLAGYMRIVGSELLTAYRGKIVNIHPSLLPAFPGKDAIKQAFEAGVTKTGVTIHFVDEGIDTGPMIQQQEVYIDATATLEELEERIHQVEHQLYPQVINQLLQNEG